MCGGQLPAFTEVMENGLTTRERLELLKLEREDRERRVNVSGNAWLRSVFGKRDSSASRDRQRTERKARYDAAVTKLGQAGKYDPSREEVAAEIGVDTRTLYKWRDAGDVSW